MLADDLKFDHELMVMPGCVALFGIQLSFFGQFREGDGAVSQGLRELLAQQFFLLALR
jgi:hypothetical protein